VNRNQVRIFLAFFIGWNLWVVPSAWGFSLTGKGTISAKLLGVQSSSDFELKVNLKDGEPTSIVSFLVEKRDLTKTPGIEKVFPSFLPDKEILNFLFQIDLAKLKEEKFLEKEVLPGLRVKILWKEEKEGKVLAEMSGEGVVTRKLPPPKVYYASFLTPVLPVRFQVTGNATYTGDGALENGSLKMTLEIPEESKPTPPPAPSPPGKPQPPGLPPAPPPEQPRQPPPPPGEKSIKSSNEPRRFLPPEPWAFLQDEKEPPPPEEPKPPPPEQPPSPPPPPPPSQPPAPPSPPPAPPAPPQPPRPAEVKNPFPSGFGFSYKFQGEYSLSIQDIPLPPPEEKSASTNEIRVPEDREKVAGEVGKG